MSLFRKKKKPTKYAAFALALKALNYILQQFGSLSLTLPREIRLVGITVISTHKLNTEINTRIPKHIKGICRIIIFSPSGLLVLETIMM